MPGDPERKSQSPEANALDNFLDLGKIALRTSQTLQETLRLLDNTERVVAPDGSFIVVRPISPVNDVVIEKYFPPTQESPKGKFSQHFMDSVDTIPGVVLLDNEIFFYGKYVEFDREANGFYVYYPTGESRALHRVDSSTTVSIRPAPWVDELSNRIARSSV